MNFLINNIIQRTEIMQQKYDDFFKEKKNFSLDPNKYKEPGSKTKKNTCA